MKFGPVGLDDAEGAVLAHSLAAGPVRFRKGRVLSADDIAALRDSGLDSVIAARLDADDVGEDEAAARIAAAMSAPGVEARGAATGRVNLHAGTAGVFTVDRVRVDRINAVDPSITLATLAAFAPVEADRMVATVKIIPFAVGAKALDEVCALAAAEPVFAVNPYRPRRVGMVQTELPSLKASVLDKTRRITEARLARSGSVLVEERRTAHRAEDVAAAIGELSARSDMVLAFGASAMTDPDDVIPAAIRAAGGTVERAGMPVDPGNLLVLGSLDGRPVLGAPGCARSPKENGFDWVLDRLMADLPVSGRDIAGMGVGGLLMEIVSRPQPRDTARPAAGAGVHAAVLAAGRSSRMEGPNKLLALFDGEPLVRRTAERVLRSRATGATLVTGHQAERIRAAVDGLDIDIADNPDFASGLASSIRAAAMRVPEGAGGMMVVLADMPAVEADDFDRLIAAFEKAGGGVIVRATHNGKRGNPVILPRRVFAEIMRLEGDTGARHLVERGLAPVVDVELGQSASLDVDTPEALAGAGGVIAPD